MDRVSAPLLVELIYIKKKKKKNKKKKPHSLPLRPSEEKMKKMADNTSPLLLPGDDDEALLLHHRRGPLGECDAVERIVGGATATGWRQLLQALFVCLSWGFDAQQLFISVFTDAQPAWRCSDGDTGRCSTSGNVSPCGLLAGSWSWDRPKHSTIISDFDLQCSGATVQGLPATAFFAGCLVGGVALSTLADSPRLGRKNMVALSFIVMSVSGALAALSPNVWVYSALRFVAGVGRSTVNACSLVLSTEIVGGRWRREAGVASYACFSLGFLSLPGIAYAVRYSSWRTLYLWVSLPSLIYTILFFYLVDESPRWLLLHGRTEEAVRILNSQTGRSSEEKIDAFLQDEILKKKKIGEVDGGDMGLFDTLRIIWERKWAAKRLSSIMAVGFGVGLGYYGMPLGVQSLGLNPYLSVAINALAEFPSSVATYLVVGRLRRRTSMAFFTTLGGTLSLACVFSGDGMVRAAVEVVGFFAMCTAFDVMLIYCLELFPTSVRNSALCMVRQAAVLGSGVAPPLVGAVKEAGGAWVTYGVFGVVMGLSGLFVFFLPETLGGVSCDTMEEEERKMMLLIADDAMEGEKLIF